MRQAAKMYLETQVTTTSQGQILIMLYDGAIKFLNQAKERMAARDYAGKGILISNAIDVINELASSLNAEKGGDLAANLNQLYFYCNKRLFMANSRMDVAPIDEVIKILNGIRSAYAQIVDSPEAVAAMAQAQANAAPAKAPRAPMGVHMAPAGAPVPAAKARNAYAAQNMVPGVAVERPQPQQAPAMEQMPTAPAAPAATRPAMPAEMPVAEAAAPETAPAMPDLDIDTPAPLPGLSQVKRMAASNLYRKFAS
ncbi:Flagellar protein FliS [uncultured delta proteobacterium]|uniref:Flagellar protein FliS n=1 Tax=uncultured delta proteobacterium TaxID=34034 RepID=A0A212KDP2_9DELT|nr:Flagellar protein FliS [uncultured delta proteobacterium]